MMNRDAFQILLQRLRASSVRRSLAGAENASGAAQREALGTLATQLHDETGRSHDRAKVLMLAAAVRELAAATH